MLQSMGSQTVGHDLATEQQQTECGNQSAERLSDLFKITWLIGRKVKPTIRCPIFGLKSSTLAWKIGPSWSDLVRSQSFLNSSQVLCSPELPFALLQLLFPCLKCPFYLYIPGKCLSFLFSRLKPCVISLTIPQNWKVFLYNSKSEAQVLRYGLNIITIIFLDTRCL